MIHQYLLDRKAAIEDLCRDHNVAKLYAFGSVVDGRFVPGKSDIDLLIEFDKNEMDKQQISRALFILWISFQELLQCKVDLISSDNLQGKYFKKYLRLYKEELYVKEV